MSTIKKFIIIDDDYFNIILCSMAIESALGEADIKTFEEPEKGLAFIQKEYIRKVGTTVLFLDINMPTLTGWEFMEEYKKFSDTIKDQFIIYIVSSSVNRRDKDKAEADRLIKGFLSKPLEHETIRSIATSENQL